MEQPSAAIVRPLRVSGLELAPAECLSDSLAKSAVIRSQRARSGEKEQDIVVKMSPVSRESDQEGKRRNQIESEKRLGEKPSKWPALSPFIAMHAEIEELERKSIARASQSLSKCLWRRAEAKKTEASRNLSL